MLIFYTSWMYYLEHIAISEYLSVCLSVCLSDCLSLNLLARLPDCRLISQVQVLSDIFGRKLNDLVYEEGLIDATSAKEFEDWLGRVKLKWCDGYHSFGRGSAFHDRFKKYKVEDYKHVFENLLGWNHHQNSLQRMRMKVLTTDSVKE